MNFKKIAKTAFFPPIIIIILLLVLSLYALIYSFMFLDGNNPVRIGSYVLSFYTLIIGCLRTPALIRFFFNFKNKNTYIQIWLKDVHLRVKVTLTGSVAWNSAYALLLLGLGMYHHSSWFYSLCGYYFSLALMRFFLIHHTRQYKPSEKMYQELRLYRTCGWVFLFTNIFLSAMIFYMIYENQTVLHNEITSIAMAAYTFTSLTMAIINLIKYRKYNSPVFSASKAISLTSACVSMLNLERTMLTTFGDKNSSPYIQRIFLSLTGGVISIFIVTMATYMIVKANRNIKYLENKNEK